MNASPPPDGGGPGSVDAVPAAWFQRLAPEEILAHTEWLGRLAKALVESSAAADDLAQDALHAAATTTAEVRDVRAYLAGTVRRLAAKRWRTEARRRRRESEVALARSPHADAADDHAERVDTLRVVLEELRALAPAQQRVVYLRFIEGLDPAEIAARVGASPSTVRSQVTRGLQALRERLDARAGGRDAWCAALVPWASMELHAGASAVSTAGAKVPFAAPAASTKSGSAAASALGASLFSMSIQSIALVAVTALVGAYCWLALPKGPEGAPGVNAPKFTESVASALPKELSGPAPDRASRNEVSPAARTLSEVQEATPRLADTDQAAAKHRVSGRLVDIFTDEPVPRAHLQLRIQSGAPGGADRSSTDRSIDFVTQPDGSFDVSLEDGTTPQLSGARLQLALRDPLVVAPKDAPDWLSVTLPLEPEVLLPVGPTYELEFPRDLDGTPSWDPASFSVGIRPPGAERDLAVVRVRKDVRTWIRFPASVAEHDSEGPWELIARQDGGGPVGRATVRRKQGIELMPVHLRFKSEGFIAFRFEAGEDRVVAGLPLSVRPTAGTEGAPITLTWLGTHSGTKNVARTPSLSPGAYEWRIDDGTEQPWRAVRVEAGEETDVLVGPEELGALFDLFVRLDVRALEDKDHHWLTYAFRESAREFFHRTSMGSHPDDPEGFLRVRLRGVREGVWFVQLQLDPGIEASLNPLRVVPGEPAPTMVLTPAQDRVPLRVQVIAKETGKVIPGAQAAYLRTMSDAAPLARDGDGGFVAKPVKSGVPMTLVASAPGYQDHAERFVPAAPENEVVIELVRGYRERVVVVNMTTSEFEANVGVFADGVEVGRTDGDGALWLTSDRRPETLEVASDDPGANVVYSSFRDFQKYGEASPMGWIFGVTRR